MKKLELTFLSLTFLSLSVFGQKAEDLNVDFMLRGHIYAKSSIVDSTALGGFGGSNNSPKKYNDSLNFSKNGVFLKIDTTNTTIINEKYNGYKLLIVNKSDSILELDASDSRLNVIAEVLYRRKWQPIEYLPSSWCGNSYHNVYLNTNEYWVFDIPKFAGKINTKIRYRLKIGKDEYVYSNQISTSINKGQLKKKQEYEPKGLMDPYND